MREAAGAVDEIGWWLDLLAEADRLARQLPASLTAHIDAHGGAHEVMQLAILWTSVSAETRHRIETGLERALCALRLVADLNLQHAPAPSLRLVEPEAEPVRHARPGS